MRRFKVTFIAVSRLWPP